MPFHDYNDFPLGTPIAGYVNINGDPPNWEIVNNGVNHIALPLYADNDFILFQNEIFTSASLKFDCAAGGSFDATSIGLFMNNIPIFSALKNTSGYYEILYGDNSVSPFYPSGNPTVIICNVIIQGQTAITTVFDANTGDNIGTFSFTFANPFVAGKFGISVGGYPGLITGFIYRLGWEESTNQQFAISQGGNTMVVNPNAVTFSANTTLKLGKYGTSRAALVVMGLLGQALTVNMEQTMRQKKDGFPEVVVAEALQAQSMTLEAQLREWRKATIVPALGLIDTDTTVLAGADVPIVDDTIVFNAAGIAVLNNPIKLATLPIVTGVGGAPLYVAGTDYDVVPRDLEGRTLLIRKGAAIPVNDTVECDYTFARVAMDSYPIGVNKPTRYYSCELIETFTNGETVKLFIPKCSISLKNALNFNVVDTGAELPIKVMGIKDPAFPHIAILEHLAAV